MSLLSTGLWKLADVSRGSTSENGVQSYAELLEENRRLKAALQSSPLASSAPIASSAPSAPSAPSASPTSPEQAGSPWTYSEFPTITDVFENDVHPASLNTKRPSTVRSLSDIFLPNFRCSRFLLEHGVVWTSWIHFAIHVPTFRLEHSGYWAQSDTIPVLQQDPSWLAIYFSFLSVRGHGQNFSCQAPSYAFRSR